MMCIQVRMAIKLKENHAILGTDLSIVCRPMEHIGCSVAAQTLCGSGDASIQ